MSFPRRSTKLGTTVSPAGRLLLLALTCCGQSETGAAVGPDAGANADQDAKARTWTADAEVAGEDGAMADADATGEADMDAVSSEDAGSEGAESADAEAPDVADSGEEPIDVGPGDDGGACGAVVEQHPIEGANHVPVCSPVTYLTKPPSSGDHYPIWAAYQSYQSAIPEGFWVHNLEHGAVVVSYNCPGGCSAEVAAAQTWIDGLPSDGACDPSAGDPRVRVVMTPDPNLDVRFAASAWGWTLRANCFDAAAFDAFLVSHYGQGPEALCAQGEDLSLGVQDGCGE